MSGLNKRLSDLEAAARPASGKIPFLVVWQDYDDQDLYWEHPKSGGGDRGRCFRREDIPEADTLLLVTYVKDWRPIDGSL